MRDDAFTGGPPITLADPDRQLTLLHAPARSRAGLAALWALDEALARLVATTKQPLIGQIRLTWWHERLTGLAQGAPAGEPVLGALAAHALPAGVTPAALAGVVEGWEELLEGGRLADDALARHARLRGGGLFACAARLLGSERDPAEAAGEGWALVDLARHVSDAEERATALRLAEPALATALAPRWSRAGRPLGLLAVLAARGPGEVKAAPARTWRALRFRLTGR